MYVKYMASPEDTFNDETIREIVASHLSYVLDFAEFITGERPDKSDTLLIAKLRLLQKQIESSAPLVITNMEVEAYQNLLIPILLYWNKDIVNQVLGFYNAYAEIGRISDPKSPSESYNPIKIIAEKSTKFLECNKVINDTLNHVNSDLLDEIGLYAVFYSFISSVEVTEYVLYKPFKEGLKTYGLENKFDAESIFSVKTKSRNKHGEYQTDSRMIRNALAHFDYDLELRHDSFTISFRGEPYGVLNFTETEFFKYIEHHKFLLQSFYSILCLMVAFSSMRYYLAKEI
jgi:hypothetical protein